MTTFVVGTDTDSASDAVCDYLERFANEDDVIHAVHTQTSKDSQKVRAGRKALEMVEERLNERFTVETHEYHRGNDPSEELLDAAEEFDADQIVIGLRRHSLTERIIGGSTGRSVLMNTSRPVVSIPLAT